MKTGIEVSINGLRIGKANPKTVLAIVFGAIVNLNLWSYDALKILYIEVIKMTSEIFEGRHKRFSIQAKYLIKYTPKGRDKILEAIYNIILGNEGLSLLRGFGLSNLFGDNLKGDPEKQSILN